MKPIVIKVCQSNEVAQHVQKLQELALLHDSIHVEIEKCLNRCSFCEDMPFVLLNNGVEFGDTVEELMEEIVESITTIRKKS